MDTSPHKTAAVASPPALVTMTEAAVARAKALLAAAEPGVMGLRIGVRERGCSGKSYTVDYAREQNPVDTIVQDRGVTLLIDPKALLVLIGSEMDYVDDGLQAQFTFRNPNEKGRCGCGESFRV